MQGSSAAAGSATRLVWAILVFASIQTVGALTNVTVDDQSPLIVYSPIASWQRINDSTTAVFDFDGGHMLTSDPAATAVFTFTGTAIYILCARWPYAVSTAVALDDGPAVIIDLVDHTRPTAEGGAATVKSAVVAEAVGLKNVSHTVTVSVGAGQTFAVVDALTYTSVSSRDTLPSSNTPPPTQLTPVPPTSTSSSASKTSKSKSHKLAIGLAIFFVLLGLCLIILGVWWFRRTRRDRGPGSGGHPFPSTRGVGARTTRAAYAKGETGEGDKEDEKEQHNRISNLRVTNPDPDSPSSQMPGALAMPIPRLAGAQRKSGAPSKLTRGSHALSHTQTEADAKGAAETQESPARSPGTFYGALRSMTTSPGRAYPVPARHGRPGGSYAGTYGESGKAYVESTAYEEPEPRGAASWVRPMTMETVPRSPTTIYSQVTALGLEEEEFAHVHARDPAYGAHDDGHGYALRAPSAVHVTGRPRASGRASGLNPEAGGQEEERWAYPQTPLAYVPVFKS